ncbi:AAA family ATPase [Pseudomonas aeruginosa]|uniref:AAA family ATPase n=1 Tax=Pseudomonas aeruginosa TaxID=287 RepID=UPI003D2E6BD6
MDQLLLYYQQFSEISKNNPFLANMLGVVFGGGVFLGLKLWAGRLFGALFRQITTTITFNNAGWHNNELEFISFLDWYMHSPWSRWSRSMCLERMRRNEDASTTVGAGWGVHFFVYKGGLFWFYKNKLDSSGSEREKVEINLTLLGRNRDLMLELFDEFRYKPKKDDVFIHLYGSEGWDDPKLLYEKPMETVILAPETKTTLLDKIQWFMQNKHWHVQRGLPYKLSILFDGPPGTGKTSLIRALATHFKRDVYVINLAAMSDSSLTKAAMGVPKGSFVVMEDFDCAVAVHARAGMTKVNKTSSSDQKVSGSVEFDLSGLTTSGVYNVLDGLVPFNDTVLFMTTNRYEMLDPAIVRHGRVDLRMTIGKLQTPEIYRYAAMMFPEHHFDQTLSFEPIAGCELQSLYFDHSSDPEAFIRSILARQEVSCDIKAVG